MMRLDVMMTSPPTWRPSFETILVTQGPVIFKIFSQKMAPTYCYLPQKLDRNIVFEEKRQFFAEN
jgi:hypothetical protein